MWTRSFLAAVLSLALLHPSFAQGQGSQQRIRDQVNKIAIGDPLTVRMIDRRELHGHLSSIEPDSFSIREGNQNQKVSIAYSEVGKVSKGYGRADSHRRLSA